MTTRYPRFEISCVNIVLPFPRSDPDPAGILTHGRDGVTGAGLRIPGKQTASICLSRNLACARFVTVRAVDVKPVLSQALAAG